VRLLDWSTTARRGGARARGRPAAVRPRSPIGAPAGGRESTFGALSRAWGRCSRAAGRAARPWPRRIAPDRGACSRPRGVRVVPQIRRPGAGRRGGALLPLPAAGLLYGVLLGMGFTTYVLSFAVARARRVSRRAGPTRKLGPSCARARPSGRRPARCRFVAAGPRSRGPLSSGARRAITLMARAPWTAARRPPPVRRPSPWAALARSVLGAPARRQRPPELIAANATPTPTVGGGAPRPGRSPGGAGRAACRPAGPARNLAGFASRPSRAGRGSPTRRRPASTPPRGARRPRSRNLRRPGRPTRWRSSARLAGLAGAVAGPPSTPSTSPTPAANAAHPSRGALPEPAHDQPGRRSTATLLTYAVAGRRWEHGPACATWAAGGKPARHTAPPRASLLDNPALAGGAAALRGARRRAPTRSSCSVPRRRAGRRPHAAAPTASPRGRGTPATRPGTRIRAGCPRTREPQSVRALEVRALERRRSPRARRALRDAACAGRAARARPSCEWGARRAYGLVGGRVVSRWWSAATENVPVGALLEHALLALKPRCFSLIVVTAGWARLDPHGVGDRVGGAADDSGRRDTSKDPSSWCPVNHAHQLGPCGPL